MLGAHHATGGRGCRRQRRDGGTPGRGRSRQRREASRYRGRHVGVVLIRRQRVNFRWSGSYPDTEFLRACFLKVRVTMDTIVDLMDSGPRIYRDNHVCFLIVLK